MQCTRCERELTTRDKIAITRIYYVDDIGRLIMIKQVSLICFPVCKKKRAKRKKGGKTCVQS